MNKNNTTRINGHNKSHEVAMSPTLPPISEKNKELFAQSSEQLIEVNINNSIDYKLSTLYNSINYFQQES